MEARIYGVLDSNDCLIDVSRTERGAKQYATKNDYNKIGYRIGYNGFISHEKINNKWEQYKEKTVNEFDRQLLNEQEQQEQSMYCPNRENY